MSDPVLARAREALRAFEAACGKADGICVGLSGGADSVALLLVMLKLREEFGFTLSAMHIDHMLRGEESDRDREFCVSLCERLGVPLEVKRIDVRSIKATGIEETARNERYRAFSERKVVALAHTASDNLETMVFSLARGTSPDGIGIPPYRRNGDGYVVRPLLGVTREETEEICRECGEAFVTDSTNSDTGYTRNFIRKEIVPKLKALSPDAEAHAAAFAALCRTDAEYFDGVLPCDGSRITATGKTHPALMQRAITKAAEAAGASDISGKHIGAVSGLIRNGRRGDSVEIKGAYAIKRRDCTEIIKGRAKSGGLSGDEEFPVGVGNTFSGKGFEFTATYDEKVAQYLKSVYSLSIFERVYDDNIYGSLYLRTRHPGDKIKFNGMTRSVKKLLSGYERDSFIRTGRPVLCDGKGTLWFPGFPPRDGGGTGKILYLIYGETENAGQN
ncbi:MAG: tRNA lysidine(34) synthetase TilS [Clostridia bacterium]|nr:tRNA lysidine(34) synthetase TilS [Clostridia bacterium]